MCHDTPTAAHLGARHTIVKVATRFWWKTYREDLKYLVVTYTTCQFRKVDGSSGCLPPMHIPSPRSPFELVGLDHLCPFSSSREESRYIIAAVDHLIELVKVDCVPDTSAVHLVTFVRR